MTAATVPGEVSALPRNKVAPGQIFIIGDSHIGLSDGNERKIVAWLDRLAALDPKALYLNGDVFHYFIGHENFYTDSVTRFFAKLRELRDAGVDICYVEGNRDFFVRGSLAEQAVSRIEDEVRFKAGSKTFLVTHGDMINDRDWPYRFWRRASKNPFTRLGVRLVPRTTARRMVDKVEKRLRRSNFKHKTRLPVELMEDFGRKRAREGVDVVVFGHFHEKLTLDAGSSQVLVLPAWYESGEAIRVDPRTGAWSFVTI